MVDEPRASGSDPAEPNPLIGEVYDQLRAIARERMRGERAGHTLESTALVHEAFLRLERAGVRWSSRRAFFQAAAEAMRRVLIDHARRRGAARRGGGVPRAEIAGVADLAREDTLPHVLALDDAIVRLEQEDAQAAQIVRLRFYAGLSVDGTAEALGISPRSVDRGWAFARAWLWSALEEPED
jgi:RNA polymerase sigma factor (TIGR02999 family)